MATVYLGVDWANNGSYTDESSNTRSLIVRRGRQAIYSQSGPEQMSAGEISSTMNNAGRRFDPYNTGGALYGNIKQGRRVKLTVTDGSVTYPLFAGYADDIRPSGYGASSIAIIRAKDGLYWLGRQNCTAAATQTNYAVYDALMDLAAQSAWPLNASATVYPFTWPLTLGYLSIDNNGDTIDTFSPNADNTILGEMQEIAAAFAGNLYVTASGSLGYQSRDASRPVRYTYTDDDITADTEVRMPWDEIYNDLRVTPNGTSVARTLANGTSKTEFGPSTMAISNNAYIQSTTQADNMLTYLGAYLPEVKRPLRVRVRTGRTQAAFGVDLCDKVRVTSSVLGIDTYYTVGGIEHNIANMNGGITTTLTLEPDFGTVAGYQLYPFTWPLTLRGDW